MVRNSSESYNNQKLKIISSRLQDYFSLDQGVIMGSTAVVSRKMHQESGKHSGEISIFRDRDAGLYYLQTEEPNKVVHIDVLHRPGEINQVDVANRIRRIIPAYLTVVDRNHDRSEEEKNLAAANLARKVILYTAMGYGTVIDPDQKAVRGTDDRYIGHVHILAKLVPRYYSLVYCIIDEVERSVIYQGGELRPVFKIVHYGGQRDIPLTSRSSLYLPPITDNMPEVLKRQNMFQIITGLSIQLGSMEAAADLLQALTPVRNYKLANLHRIHENLGEILSQIVSANLARLTPFGYTLTKTGREMEEFLHRNQKELAAEIRKTIRQFKAVPARYRSFRYSHLKSKEKQFPDRHKTVPPNSNKSWPGEIAVPETVVQAAKRCFLSGSSRIKISDRDIRVYARKSYAPVDTCLLVDCSGSMMGERIKAVGYVAKYLLLNSREKISLVTFQEKEAKVMVPFTRSYEDLHKGLAKIVPSGLTPLAHGITVTLDMFKNKRPRNPLLVLVTDGIPNHPLWTTDPVKDALKAAAMIAEQKIRFVCIGIDPDYKFLPLLAEAGKGNIYIVDENDRNNMIDIITREKKQYQGN